MSEGGREGEREGKCNHLCLSRRLDVVGTLAP